MIVLSPSNLKSFRDCPRRFQAQYITKELPWTESPAAARGTQLHKLMEIACLKGWDAITWPAKEAAIEPVARHYVDLVWGLRSQGYIVQVELQAAINGTGWAVDWWDKSAFMRSKIDIFASHPDRDRGIIIDWKTGKPWDDELQLHVNAMCMVPYVDLWDYDVMFAYLDQGTARSYKVTVDLKEPGLFDKLKHADTPLLSTMLVIERLKEAYAADRWIETKNNFCMSCGLKTTGCPVWRK